MPDGILITGGYGEVGRRLAAELVARYPGAVIVAGRDAANAAALAARLGHGCRSLQLDIGDAAALPPVLTDVRLTVNCVPDRTLHLLHQAVERGLAYTDVTPSLMRDAALALRARAEQSGARVIVGAGVAPGISSVMARSAVERLGNAHTVDSALLFSLGDVFGAGAIDYLAVELSEPFRVTENGRERTVRSFTDPRRFEFPQPLGMRTVYRAPFADQFSFPLTLGVQTASAWLALEPSWVARLIAAVVRTSGGSFAASANGRAVLHRLAGLLRGWYRGENRFALVVRAYGAHGGSVYSLSGRNQSEATAIGAALIAGALYDDEVDQPGVWFPEQVLAADLFLQRLARSGLSVSVRPFDQQTTARPCSDRGGRWLGT